jgi:hypothetical protein
MGFGRTILIFLMAMSVAILPAAGSSAAVFCPTADISHASASMEDMHECCCPKELPQGKAIDDCCSSMAACSVNCFSIAGTSSLLVFPLLLGKVLAASVGNSLHSQTGSPPFRPPRV